MYTKYFAQNPRALTPVFLYANGIIRLICTELCACGECVWLENFYLFLVCSGTDVCEVL